MRVFLNLLILSLFQYSFANAASEKLVITGSSTLAPLVAEVAKSFEKKYPGVKVDVQTGGSSRGVADVRREVSDIGMVSRALKPSEKDLTDFTIATDGISMIVHQSNPIKELTEKQIVDIYQGKIKRWSELGGKDVPITVVHKADGRSTQELFLKYFKLKNSSVKAHVIIGDNEQGIKTVAGNPNALAYVSIGTAEYNAHSGVPIRLLSLDGVEASVQNVANLKFPLSRKLILVTTHQDKPLIQKFIKFAQSNEVKPIVKEQYFVPSM